MKAGRELDAKIETEVFGNEVVERMCLQSYDCGTWEDAEEWYEGKLKEIPEMRILPCVHDGIEYVPIVHYSTQIADAMPVLEKFPNASIQYCRGEYDVYIEAEGYGRGEGHSNVLAHAICLAALAVVERRDDFPAAREDALNPGAW